MSSADIHHREFRNARRALRPARFTGIHNAPDVKCDDRRDTLSIDAPLRVELSLIFFAFDI